MISSPSDDTLTALTADCDPPSKTAKSPASGAPETDSDILSVTVFVPAVALAEDRTGAIVSFVTVTLTGAVVVARALPAASAIFALTLRV